MLKFATLVGAAQLRVSLCLLVVLLCPVLTHGQGGVPDQEFEKALKFYDAAQYVEAAAAFKRITERDRGNAEAYYQLGNSYFRMSRVKDAMKAYQRAVELKPDHYLAFNNLGTAQHSLRQFKEAIGSYQAALRVDPDYPEALLGLGVVYLELKDQDGALEQHRRLTAIDGERADKLYSYINNKKITLEVLNGKALYLAKPSYPPIARQAHASGTVIVWVSIDETGKVVSASVLTGHPLLRQPSLAAAKEARFTPTKVEGRPVRVTGVIHYNYVAE